MERTIEYLVVHATATPQTATVQGILNYWKRELGWKNPGYHYLISPNGVVNHLHPESKVANGVRGYNQRSVHVSYIGGQHADDRTPAQKQSLYWLLWHLKSKYPKAEILGHRDFPMVTKACPSFDAKAEYAHIQPRTFNR